MEEDTLGEIKIQDCKMNGSILCCIFNHNSNDKAIEWYQRLHNDFDTVILDSGSCPACSHEAAVNLPNIFYSGLFNEACSLALEKGCKWLMIVTSDIEIDDSNAAKLVAAMNEISDSSNVALYQPSCRWSLKGRALYQSVCHFTGRMRSVNFQEGWFHMVRTDILSDVFPVDCSVNRLGWGIDLALSHIARIRHMLVLVDDRVKVLHPRGTGYNKEEALSQMRAWHATIPGYTSPRHFRPLREKIRF